MFGHHDEQQNDDQAMAQPMSMQPVDENLMGLGAHDQGFAAGAPPTPAQPFNQGFAPSQPSVAAVPPTPTPMTPPHDSTPALPAHATADDTDDDKLLDIKREALGDLSPLVSHLDQTPEEKFRTTMMLIQAVDNQDLIPEAYKAAQAIPDEKARAQALLDVVNEINYFTQNKNS